MSSSRAALFVSFVLATSLFASEPVRAVQAGVNWLTADEIMQQFNDATVDGRYASGKAFTERYSAGGQLTYTEHGLTLGGHWSITDGTLCTIYDYDASGGCYRVTRVDTNCYEFYFASRTEEAAPGAPGSKPRWTARGALQGKASACKDEPSV
jgi:hypothetical protein